MEFPLCPSLLNWNDKPNLKWWAVLESQSCKVQWLCFLDNLDSKTWTNNLRWNLDINTNLISSNQSLPDLCRLATICCTLFWIVRTTIVTSPLTSIFWGNPSPVSSYMVAIDPCLAFSHASQIKDNWVHANRRFEICLRGQGKEKDKTPLENFPFTKFFCFLDTVITNMDIIREVLLWNNKKEEGISSLRVRYYRAQEKWDSLQTNA